MSVTRMDHFNLSTHNFKDAVERYHKILGFRLAEEGRDEKLWCILPKNVAALWDNNQI